MERFNLTDDNAMTSAARIISTPAMARLFRMSCESSHKINACMAQRQHALPVADIPPGTWNRNR